MRKMYKMTRIYFYKQYKLYVSSTCVTVESPEPPPFTVKTYYFTGRMKGNTKESVVKYLKRIDAI